jgi:hypothetical protein
MSESNEKKTRADRQEKNLNQIFRGSQKRREACQAPFADGRFSMLVIFGADFYFIEL